MTEKIEIVEDLRKMYDSTDPDGFLIRNYPASVTRTLIERLSRAEQRVKELEQENTALNAERCPACGGRDKISNGPTEFVCQHCSDLKRLEELEQENARLKAPVSDAEWAQCYWTSETGLRGLVGSFLAARAAQKGDGDANS